MGKASSKLLRDSERKFSKDELHLLDLKYRDLEDRSPGKGIDRSTFLLWIPWPGILGERLFDVFDYKTDGVVDYEEFVIGLSVCCRGNDDERLSFFFRVCDIAKDNVVTSAELFTILNQLPQWLVQLLADNFRVEEPKDTPVDSLTSKLVKCIMSRFVGPEKAAMGPAEFIAWLKKSPVLVDYLSSHFPFGPNIGDAPIRFSRGSPGAASRQLGTPTDTPSSLPSLGSRRRSFPTAFIAHSHTPGTFARTPNTLHSTHSLRMPAGTTTAISTTPFPLPIPISSSSDKSDSHGRSSGTVAAQPQLSGSWPRVQGGSFRILGDGLNRRSPGSTPLTNPPNPDSAPSATSAGFEASVSGMNEEKRDIPKAYALHCRRCSSRMSFCPKCHCEFTSESVAEFRPDGWILRCAQCLRGAPTQPLRWQPPQPETDSPAVCLSTPSSSSVAPSTPPRPNFQRAFSTPPSAPLRSRNAKPSGTMEASPPLHPDTEKPRNLGRRRNVRLNVAVADSGQTPNGEGKAESLTPDPGASTPNRPPLPRNGEGPASAKLRRASSLTQQRTGEEVSIGQFQRARIPSIDGDRSPPRMKERHLRRRRSRSLDETVEDGLDSLFTRSPRSSPRGSFSDVSESDIDSSTETDVDSEIDQLEVIEEADDDIAIEHKVSSEDQTEQGGNEGEIGVSGTISASLSELSQSADPGLFAVDSDVAFTPPRAAKEENFPSVSSLAIHIPGELHVSSCKLCGEELAEDAWAPSEPVPSAEGPTWTDQGLSAEAGGRSRLGSDVATLGSELDALLSNIHNSSTADIDTLCWEVVGDGQWLSLADVLGQGKTKRMTFDASGRMVTATAAQFLQGSRGDAAGAPGQFPQTPGLERLTSLLEDERPGESLGVGAVITLVDQGYEVLEHEGFLFKTGRKTRKMRRRYFVLIQNLLYYFAPKNRSKPRGVIFLEGASVRLLEDASPLANTSEHLDFLKRHQVPGYYGFQIIPASAHHAKPNVKVLYTRTSAEREEWVGLLKQATRAGSFEDDFILGKQLGKGKFSKVFEAKHKATGESYAVKIIQRSSLNASLRELLRQEVAILKLVRHPHIVRMEGVYEDLNQLYIVMELLDGGDLLKRIDGRPCFKEAEAKVLMKQLVESVAYLHGLGVIHRDIKPENILCKGKDPTNWNIKIADFGLSKLVHPDEVLDRPCGTLSYVAPEVLSGTGYTTAADLWSVGVILFLVVRGRLPFNGSTAEELMRQTVTHPLTFSDSTWSKFSPEARDFVARLLERDPAKRLTARQALCHRWLAS